jgi:uncharacterized protein
MKKTLIIGASTDSFRYSYKAIVLLVRKKYDICAIGMREGNLHGVEIKTQKEDFEDIHTVSLYIAPERQKEYYDYIIDLEPKRVIFNPGTYNPELANKCKENKIEVVQECTVQMLNSDEY